MDAHKYQEFENAAFLRVVAETETGESDLDTWHQSIIDTGGEGRDAPHVLPFHPSPIQTRVIYMATGDGTTTTIARQWPPGAPPSCRLCERCVARNDFCVLVIDDFIPRREAAQFSTRGLSRVDERTLTGVALAAGSLRVIRVVPEHESDLV
jgi:hypothetical protein